MPINTTVHSGQNTIFIRDNSLQTKVLIAFNEQWWNDTENVIAVPLFELDAKELEELKLLVGKQYDWDVSFLIIMAE